MNNIRFQFGSPRESRKIKDMQPGEIGYTVEWAIENGILNEEFHVNHKGGTASVKVTCISVGVYDISYEKPIYKNIFTGELTDE